MGNDEKHEDISYRDKIDFLNKKMSRFDFYINTTNTKASVIMAWNGIIIGTILLKYDIIMSLYPCVTLMNHIASIILIVIGVLSITSVAFAFQVIFPFLTSSARADNSKSLFFFGDVGNMTIEEYERAESNTSYKKIFSDAVGQYHILAVGLRDKMKHMRRSIMAVFYTICAIFLMLLLKVVTYAL